MEDTSKKIENEVVQPKESTNNEAEQIKSSEAVVTSNENDVQPTTKKKKSKSLIIAIICILIASAFGGYYYYTHRVVKTDVGEFSVTSNIHFPEVEQSSDETYDPIYRTKDKNTGITLLCEVLSADDDPEDIQLGWQAIFLAALSEDSNNLKDMTRYKDGDIYLCTYHLDENGDLVYTARVITQNKNYSFKVYGPTDQQEEIKKIFETTEFRGKQITTYPVSSAKEFLKSGQELYNKAFEIYKKRENLK